MSSAKHATLAETAFAEALSSLGQPQIFRHFQPHALSFIAISAGQEEMFLHHSKKDSTVRAGRPSVRARARTPQVHLAPRPSRQIWSVSGASIPTSRIFVFATVIVSPSEMCAIPVNSEASAPLQNKPSNTLVKTGSRFMGPRPPEPPLLCTAKSSQT
jgi:hypothetical protein